ncbi:hypothetical protein CEXT_63701 [Caerostris extrusa]|uniref:Uncharacterized protein n=1 Tax=Caerostris extrusa TaxID=172846 RepID=A0AAV4TVE8_CAEEX|nr:hypothetical protein CEXT_63701 [Caerostris extrusa]
MARLSSENWVSRSIFLISSTLYDSMPFSLTKNFLHGLERLQNRRGVPNDKVLHEQTVSFRQTVKEVGVESFIFCADTTPRMHKFSHLKTFLDEEEEEQKF